jgi:pimeloyl-ACP methyl ester carboxylesterase
MKKGFFACFIIAVVFLGAAFPCKAAEIKGEPVYALFDIGRSRSFWDFPWPSDAFLTGHGTVDLSGYPGGYVWPVRSFIQELKARFSESVYGFGLNSPIFFRFSGPLDPGLIPCQIENPCAADPFLIIRIHGKGPRLIPLAARYWDRARGDPYLSNHMLSLLPMIGKGLYPGTTYAAVITHRVHSANNIALKRSPAFDELWKGRGDPKLIQAFRLEELKAALSEIGLEENRVVAATVFTTWDTDRIAEELAKSIRQNIQNAPYGVITGFKEVREVELHWSKTPSGKKAFTYTVRYVSGGEDHTYVGGGPSGEEVIEISPEKYPYRVFEGRTYTPNFQGPLSDKPYGSRWILPDMKNRTGRIKFSKDVDGQLVLDVEPVPEPVRFALYLPHDGTGRIRTGCPVIIWETGTGGTAYSPVRRLFPEDKTIEVLKVMARHGFAIICYDLQLHGQRYPLLDEGMNLSLTYNNMLNPYGMQGNIMQSCIDGAAMNYLALLYLNDFLAGREEIAKADVLAPDKMMLFGHSLGGGLGHMTLHLAQFDHALLSGGSGHEMLFMERTDQMPLDQTKALAAVAGIPAWGWSRFGLFHPLPPILTTLLEPCESLNYAYGVTTPTTYFMGIGDVHVPNECTRALHAANPVSVLVEYEASSSYDPHFCTWREQVAYDRLDQLLTELDKEWR